MNGDTENFLHWFDYVVFIAMLSMSTGIALYFGFFQKSHGINSWETNELGGRQMSVVSVVFSLIVTYFSPVLLIGITSEIYIHGSQFMFIFIAPVCMAIFLYFVTIPVFHELKVVSVFEYLQKRFDYKIRLLGSVISLLSTIFYMPIVIYATALAFNQTTGISIHVIAPVVMSICIFYNCVGGIKAFVWMDFIQAFYMCGVMLLIMIKGTMMVGGVSNVFERNLEGGRLELIPDFRFDVTIRHSFWSLIIGGSCFFIVENCNHSKMQKLFALRDVKRARRAANFYAFGLICLIGVCVYCGFLIFATYHNCDPLKAQKVQAKDQLLPLLVTEVLRDSPGFLGIFVSAVLSAALTSLSSCMNSLSAIVLEDFLKPIFNQKLDLRKSLMVRRFTYVVSSGLAVILVYVVQHFGAILQLSMSVIGACLGNLFGMFLIGLTMPWVGKRATFCGALISFAVMVYCLFKAQSDIATGITTFETKPTSIAGCHSNFTNLMSTTESGMVEELPQQKQFYHVSYLFYSPIGTLLTCFWSFVFSFFFGFEASSNVNPKLIAPFMRKFFKSMAMQSVALPDEQIDMISFEMGGKYNNIDYFKL